MRTRFAILAGTAMLVTPSLAYAQGCPPGSWFCDDAPAPPASDDASAPDADEGDTGDEALPDAPEPPKTHGKTPPVVVYAPAGEDDKGRVIVVDRPVDVPPPKRQRYRPRWGLNLRLEGVGMGHDANQTDKNNNSSGMAGLGFSFRYRPVLHFAFDVGLDFFDGRDWSGYQRNEDALMFNGIIFFNPKDAVQFYTIGGFGFARARVQVDNGTDPVTNEDYSYFGGQLGVGLEFRVSHRVSLNLDAIGFIRGRTNPQAQTQPEFTDPTTGRSTNTSGGGLFRGGITFYW